MRKSKEGGGISPTIVSKVGACGIL